MGLNEWFKAQKKYSKHIDMLSMYNTHLYQCNWHTCLLYNYATLFQLTCKHFTTCSKFLRTDNLFKLEFFVTNHKQPSLQKSKFILGLAKMARLLIALSILFHDMHYSAHFKGTVSPTILFGLHVWFLKLIHVW